MPFSQNQEEQAILNYFGDFVGTFADIGANDGQTFSNTRALALKDWKGVCVEPSPRAFQRLKQLYDGHKGIYTYPYAISNKNGTLPLFESGALCSAADVGLVSTFHSHEKARFSRTVKYDPIEVKTFTWKTAINRWKYKKFDMFSIDVEGDELSFLNDIEFTDTKLVVLEWNSKPEIKAEYDKIMTGFGIIYTSAENLIYAR
jgi:FkbM family methyltransferase